LATVEFITLPTMGNGRNPYLRYRILHTCLSDKQKRYWSIVDLQERLAAHDLIVERRSILYDMEAMRLDERLGYKAPIVYNRKERGYCYSDPTFNIDRIPLTEEDYQALTLAADVLHQYKGARVVQQFEGLLDRLGRAVNHLKQPVNNKLIAFENTPYYKGREYFDALVNAVTRRQPLVIRYKKFNRDEIRVHVFHPYFLKEYHGRWYVLGYSEAREAIIVLGLDRIEKLEPAAVSFRENKDLKPKEYFQNTLGVTLGIGPVEYIELWFNAHFAPYLKTQYIHHSQYTVRADDHGLVIALRLIPNPELKQLILSYGDGVQVLKPDSLRKEIEEVWKRAVRG
jgi:predicted DNA-binding transcriptional regulator YafY